MRSSLKNNDQADSHAKSNIPTVPASGPRPFESSMSRKELDDEWTATLRDIFIGLCHTADTSVSPRTEPDPSRSEGGDDPPPKTAA